MDALMEMVWPINLLMLMAIIAIALCTLAVAWFRRALRRRRRRVLERHKAGLSAAATRGAEYFKTTCPKLVNSWSLDQTIHIARDWTSLIPKEFAPILRQCLHETGKLRAIERFALGRADKWRRISALRALGCIGSSSVVATLRVALRSKDEDVAYFAMISLSELQSHDSAEALLDFMARDGYMGQKIASLLEHFQPDVLEAALKASHYHDKTARYWALKLLVKLKPKGQTARILDLTQDPSPDVRAAACECLGELRDKAASPALLRCLRDEAWFVQMHAIRALTKVAPGEHLDDFLAMLKEGTPNFVKESVQNALAQDMDQAIAPIRKRLEGQDSTVKRFCIRAIVEANYVGKILNDAISEDAGTRAEARKLLGLMIRSGIFFGLKRSLEVFAEGARRDILQFVREVDPALAAGM